MPPFRYRAVKQIGALVVGDVQASPRQEVLRCIEYLGYWPIDARSAGKLLPQVALLIGAGLTLETALQTLEDDSNRALSRFARALRSEIAAGDSLGEARERHAAILEPMSVAMVRGGEASGKLDAVLQAIVDDRTRQEILAERISSAIRYPAFLAISATLILLFFLVYVVAPFEPVFRDLGARLNAQAALVLAVSNWLRHHEDVSLGAGLIASLATWLIFTRRGVRARLLAVLGTEPGFAGSMRDRRTARIIGTLGLLVENGVTLPNAVKIARGVIVEPCDVGVIDRVHDQVRSGRRFVDFLADADLVPAIAVRMLRIGDETGDWPSIARQAPRFYGHRLGIGLDRLTGRSGRQRSLLSAASLPGQSSRS
jgi:general secretion pathway protein F